MGPGDNFCTSCGQKIQ
nr:hypothetical protein [uncultured Methanobrevibacter sp.]